MKFVALTAILATTLFAVSMVGTVAAPNFYGTGGLIEIPDDTLYPVGAAALAYHFVTDPGNYDGTVNTFTVGTGITPNLSVSGGIKTNGDTDALLNGKYRLIAESATQPSVTVGVIDALAELGDDPSIYIVLGKNLTAAAEEVAGGESKPLRGYIGLGSGSLKGAFVGLDWTLTPKLSAMLEYINSDKGFEGDSHFNGGIRLAVTNEIRIDASLLDFSDFSAGISYNAIKF